MALSDKQWLLGGCVILGGVSSLIFLGPIPSILLPMPLPVVLVAFMSKIVSPAVIPIFYATFLLLTSGSRSFAKVVLAMIVFMGTLNFVYMHHYWSVSLQFQGELHTKVVAAANLIGFCVALTIAAIAIKKSSKQSALFANLVLFFLLSWCAFPYIGELA